MNKKNIDRMIPLAITAISKTLLNNRTSIESKYNGYINAYGPTIIQSGILQAVFFYEKDDRKEINSLLSDILTAFGTFHNNGETSLSTEIRKIEGDPAKKRLMKNRLLEAITATKLAIKTFRIEKSES